MTDRDALLRAILANPDEDTPRLAFADLLDEEGERKRAAFIRSQIEGHRTGASRDADGLFPWAAGGWFAGVPLGGLRFDPVDWADRLTPDEQADFGVTRALVTRGFVGAVACRLVVYRVAAASLFREHPITRVVLTDKRPARTNTVRVPGVSRPPGVYGWTSDASDRSPHTPSVLPQAWIDEFGRRGMGRVGRGFLARQFDTADEAQGALSELCVALGRRAAQTGDAP
jgi:uncharacterized protein (TIGR02996 family)